MIGAFKDYLAERALIKENQLPYYLRWVTLTEVQHPKLAIFQDHWPPLQS